MAEMNEYPSGTFCWVDLGAKDAGVARDFYTKLFGWTAIDAPAGDAGVYTMLQKDGKDVGAMYAMSKEMLDQGVPTHWQSYVSVDDVDAAAKKVEELGGVVMMPPFDVMQAGRMTIVQDPGKASFALWQPKEHGGARLVNEPGSLCWNELYTHDVEGAGRFYEKLFGWSRETMPSADGGDYVIFKNGERPAAGMMAIRQEWGPVPPNWAIYLAVADLDATIASATAMGATMLTDPIAVENVGRFTAVQDPQGAHFCVIQMASGAAD